jgi:hypothetical protein
MSPLVPTNLLPISVFAKLLGTIWPLVDARPTLLVLFVTTGEDISILKMHRALAMRSSILPLALENATFEEQGAEAIALARHPLATVNGTIFPAHYTEALALAATVPEALVSVASWPTEFTKTEILIGNGRLRRVDRVGGGFRRHAAGCWCFASSKA